jgi:hypothetical protein
MTSLVGRSLIVGMTAGALLAVAAPSAEARRGEPLSTQRGVLTLGGRLAFELMHVNPDPGNSATGVMLNFSPSFGGFVVKNLLLEGALGIKVGVGDLYDNTPKVVSFAFGVQYLFNFRSIVVPYLGVRFGPLFYIPADGRLDTRASLAFQIPLGILIALNQHVGLILGTELSVAVGVSGQPKETIITLPIGYLGVNAYF